MTTFPLFVCFFKTLVNQVAFNLAIYWLSGEFKGNLCIAVNLYITVTWPFPKGDRYIYRFDCNDKIMVYMKN